MRNALDGFGTLISPAAVGDAFQEGMKRGRAERAEREVRGALAAYGNDPTDPRVFQPLVQHKPELAFKLRDAQRDDEFHSALGGYMRAQRPTTGALATLGAVGGSSANSMASPTGMPADVAPTAGVPTTAPSPGTPGADFSILGEPEDDADNYFLEMVANDPVKAMEIDSKLRNNMVDRIKAEREGYGYGASMLAGVDESTWAQRRAAIIQKLAPMRLDAARVLPEQFPGEEGVRQLQEQALGVKDQLSLFLQRSNIEADNERADRNTDDLIGDRAARRNEARRYHDVQSGNVRRGQDVRDRTQRRGQSKRGTGRGGGRENLPVVNSPAEAMKLAPGTKFKTPDGRVKIR